MHYNEEIFGVSQSAIVVSMKILFRRITFADNMRTADRHNNNNNNNNNDNNNNTIIYFNVLTQQLLEPVTESAQDNNKCTKIINYLQNSKINDS
jgi:hypothetical protein